jgi:transcriptional regulator with XRE-family HTH domain
MLYTKILEIRVMKKITLGVMASELNVSIRYYIAIEAGEIDLKLSMLFRIIEILDICPYYLFESAENNLT